MAVARKLVTIAFLMLKNNEPYRYARPALMRGKFAALQARGQESRGTDASAKPKPRAKGKPGLAEVYRAAGLPAVTCPEELTSGEQRMLAERELDEFVGELYYPAAASDQGGSRTFGKKKADCARRSKESE
jgi:hypothetical protein